MLSAKQDNIWNHFDNLFSMTRSGIEPTTSARGANALTTEPPLNRHMVNTTAMCLAVDIFFKLFLVCHDDDEGRRLCYSALVTLCNICKSVRAPTGEQKHRPVDIRHPARRRSTFHLQTQAPERYMSMRDKIINTVCCLGDF